MKGQRMRSKKHGVLAKVAVVAISTLGLTGILAACGSDDDEAEPAPVTARQTTTTVAPPTTARATTTTAGLVG